jgi:hypothetical protein
MPFAVTLEQTGVDRKSAFVGSLLCIIAWRLIRRGTGKKPDTE